MKKLISIILLVSFISIITTGCMKNKSILGEISDGNIYSNSYFNFSLSIPNNWHYYSDEEREDLTITYNENSQDEKFTDYKQATNVLLMILYRDESVEHVGSDEHNDGEHIHTSPILVPGIIINALKNKPIPNDTTQVTINNLDMYQEDILLENEMYTMLYYPNNDFIITFKLNYHDEQEALLLMDILLTIANY